MSLVWKNRLNCNISRFVKKNDQDEKFYYLKTFTQILILAMNVDNFLITNNNTKKISWLKNQLQYQYGITNLNRTSHYLDLEMNKKLDGPFIHQTPYIFKILQKKKFFFFKCWLGKRFKQTKSTNDYILTLGGTPIIWVNHKENAIAYFPLNQNI
jgi:hypothetical protein